MFVDLKSIDKQRVGFFRFKELNGQYLLTNDIGDWCFLDPQEFKDFLAGKIEQTSPDKYQELGNKGFIRDQLDFDGLVKRYAKKNMFLGQGPSLHIVVVTLRCDHKCIYCQTSSQSLEAKNLDMDIPTAQKVVDIIFESPSQNITLEFQGGEPLVNWDTIKCIIGYSKDKNITARKNLLFALVSNLNFLSRDIFRFLKDNDVSICTSFDGPECVHNKNRITLYRSSYKRTMTQLKKIKSEFDKNNIKNRPNALLTVTKYSLGYPKEIVEEYIKIGLDKIHLRPVNPFGINKKIWDRISFTPKEFFDFYKQALDYIIELNFKGKYICETTAQIFLTKILTNTDPNHLDHRSPCGAGIGQLAYNYNGDVYTCDEGRMLSRMQDESFRLGNVRSEGYRDIVNSAIIKTICIASCLDGLPKCSQCAYKPYCGVCPVYNYVKKDNIFDQQPNNERCAIHMAIFDYLFERLKEEKCRKVFEDWVFGYKE